VFGRRGARPLNRAEVEALYTLNGKLFTVSDTPGTAVQTAGDHSGPGTDRGGQQMSWLERVRAALRDIAAHLLAILG